MTAPNPSPAELERLPPGHPDRCNHLGPLRHYGGYWCELRRGHDGDHKQLGRTWARDFVRLITDEDFGA
jgi:hypothetical protein